MTLRITKWLVPAILTFTGFGFSQGISVEHESIPERLKDVYEYSRLHFELKSQHYDHALSAMMLAEDIDLIEETTGSTALGLAALDESADAIDVVKPLVLKYGANLKLPDVKGFTPLHSAVRAGNFAVVEFLAYHGADLESINQQQPEREMTPLYMAHLYDRPRIAEFLRKRGADELPIEIQEDLEITASMGNAAMEIAKKLARQKINGTIPKNNQQAHERELLMALTDASQETYGHRGKLAELQKLLANRDLELKAVEMTPAEPVMTQVENRKAVKKTLAELVLDN